MDNQPNQLIVVKQLPVIEDQLRALKIQIEAQVEEALSLECTEDTYKLVKQDRAALAKQFKALEGRRIEVKNAILGPYEAFDTVYDECVRSVFLNADNILKRRIAEVEDGLKASKAAEVVAYFEEYRSFHGLDPAWVTWNRAGIVVGMSESKKSLKAKAKAFIDRILDDLAMIATQENADEILVEYKQTLNASSSVTNVADRHRKMEAERARRIAMQEQQAARERAAAEVAAAATQQHQETEAPVAAPTAMEIPTEEEPVVVETPSAESKKIYKLEFRVFGTVDALRDVKNFLEKGGYRYEQL